MESVIENKPAAPLAGDSQDKLRGTGEMCLSEDLWVLHTFILSSGSLLGEQVGEGEVGGHKMLPKEGRKDTQEP